jgi:simple sugar transport system ATP-binding protein
MRSAAPPLFGRRVPIQGMVMSDAGLSAAVQGGGDAAAVAAVRNITKRFPGVLANDKVSLDFRAGEIHVLLGENGAGKSTLIAILAACCSRTGRDLAGGECEDQPPRESSTGHRHGVPQLLVPSLSVIENLMLGGPWWQRLGRAAALKRFNELSILLGVTIAADALVGRLSLGEQQQVEIMRALWRGEKVLILERPPC